MKRYTALLRLAWKRVLVYRGVSFVYLLLSLLNIFLSISVWSIAYKNKLGQPAEPFALVITYFFLTILFNQLVNSFTAGTMADDHIQRGELSVFLLKPFPYLFQMVILEIPWRLLAFLMSLPAVGLMMLLYNHELRIHIELVILAYVLVVFAYALSFLLQINFAMLTFWFEDTHGILSVLEIFTILFSGVGIPIFFFPPVLKIISMWLPFQYVLYFPVSFALGRLSPGDVTKNLVFLVGWITLLSFTANYLWRAGLRKFTSEGI